MAKTTMNTSQALLFFDKSLNVSMQRSSVHNSKISQKSKGLQKLELLTFDILFDAVLHLLFEIFLGVELVGRLVVFCPQFSLTGVDEVFHDRIVLGAHRTIRLGKRCVLRHLWLTLVGSEVFLAVNDCIFHSHLEFTVIFVALAGGFLDQLFIYVFRVPSLVA